MTAEEAAIQNAVEVAVLLGAEQEKTDLGYGYTHEFPFWFYEAVSAALPEHLGFGYVEGVLIQRGWYADGGYRLAREEDRGCKYSFSSKEFEGGLRSVFPAVLRARVRRLFLEGS